LSSEEELKTFIRATNSNNAKKSKMRKSKPKKRHLLPDPKFSDTLVTRFVNDLMVDGKKSVAFAIFYDTLEIVGKRVKDTDLAPLDIWKKALENITPMVEVKSRRVGGATFQVPMEIRPERKISISIKNMILFARKRSGKSMADKLSAEIVAAFNEEGGAFKKKEDTHRMAEANRAFAHFRF
jgi:small subunit ribosomal protein S7